MFGYVNICMNNISEEDKLLYQSYYCGLCKAIGKKSQKFRFTLSHDLTFLSVLLSAVIKEDARILRNKKCIAHHIKKHDEIEFNKILDYASDMNILLTYLKICDDADDDRKILSVILRFILKFKASNVCKKYKNLSEGILKSLSELSELEKKNCPSIDMTADCFALITEKIFAPDFIEDEETKKILAWIGYNTGRWIYIIDAYSDIEKDKKSGSYNAFLCSNSDIEENKQLTYDTLTYTLNNIANAYDLLKIYRNDSLLRNILYSGLPGKQDSIFFKTEEENGSL